MAKIVMLGSGIMATALSFPASENGNEVRLVGTHLDRDIIDSIKTKGIHPDLGLKVNEGVKAYQLEDAEEAFADADVVMCGVNSFGIEWAGEQLAGLLKPGQHVLCITKGMRADEDGTMHILPEVLQKAVGPELASQVSWSAIVGPSIAGELAVHHDTFTRLLPDSATACWTRKEKPMPNMCASTMERPYLRRDKKSYANSCSYSGERR